MIQHAFKSAYTNQVSAQNKTISNVTQGIKDLATVGIGALGFAGALGDGIVAEGAEHALAGRVGGVGGNIMLASLKEKKATAEAKEMRKDLFSSEDVASTVESTLGSNPINRSAKKSLSTVFERLTQAKREGLINKKGNIETDFGDIDPNSPLGQEMLEAMGGEKK